MQKSKIALITLTLVLGILLTAGLAQAAVTLSRFEGRWDTGANKIFLEFDTGSETSHAFFYVWRSTQNLPIVANQIDTSLATRIVPVAENPNTVINQGAVFNADGACSSQGQEYEVSDIPESGATVYYYYLESYACSGGDTEFHGNRGETAGLEVRRPGSEAPTSTPTATQSGGTNPTSTATTQPTRTSTPEATSSGGNQNPPTAGPTGTLIPSATTGTVATPTTRPDVTATTGTGTTATATTRPAPTNAPQPTTATNPNPPTNVPQPTTATNPNPPQPTIATQPTESIATVAPIISDATTPTQTPAPEITAAFTPVSTAEAVGGTMAQGGVAPTPTLSGAFASSGGTAETTGVEGQEGPVVAGDTDTAGVDRLIQGLVAVILIGVIGLGGFLGWSYYRSRA